MNRMHVLVEGPTEQVLFDQLFAPYWESCGWLVSSSIVKTARLRAGGHVRGGVSRWSKLETELRRLLRGSHFQVLTTMIDYYGAPADTPGMSDRPEHGTPAERVCHVEDAIKRHFMDERLIPHLTLHETEAWVFAASSQLARLAGDPSLHRRLQRESDTAGGPEGVNDG